MIIDSYDIETEPIISLKDFYGEQKHLVDICLIIFSAEIHKHLLEKYPCEQIAAFTACNGDTPIYKMQYKEVNIAFYLTGIGSTMASCMCYEANWLIGATKFIMFGSCGSLDREQTEGKFIIPTESYRGDGCSYYFAEPADYIKIKNSTKLAAIFEELGVPYVLGKVWTTDSMIRETKGLVAKRKQKVVLLLKWKYPAYRLSVISTDWSYTIFLSQEMFWRQVDTKWKDFMMRTIVLVNYILHWKLPCVYKF